MDNNNDNLWKNAHLIGQKKHKPVSGLVENRKYCSIVAIPITAKIDSYSKDKLYKMSYLGNTYNTYVEGGITYILFVFPETWKDSEIYDIILEACGVLEIVEWVRVK